MVINGNQYKRIGLADRFIDKAWKSYKNVDKDDTRLFDGGARGLERLRRLTDNQKIMSENLIGPTTHNIHNATIFSHLNAFHQRNRLPEYAPLLILG